MKTLTAANSIFTLSIGDVLGVPIQLEGYTTSDAFTVDGHAPTEVRQGVDGHMSTGFVHSLKKITIKLEPTSKSVAAFDAWNAAMETTVDAYLANAEISLPGVGMKYVCTNGALTKYTPMPPVKKMLDPLDYEITFEKIVPIPL